MAAERSFESFLDTIKVKIENYLKHIPYRQLKLNDLTIANTNKQDTRLLQVLINDRGSGDDINISTVITEKDLKKQFNIKDYVKYVLEKIPAKYMQVKFDNIENTADLYLKNFSNKTLSDSFILEKVPYRQLQISVNDRRFFVKLGVKSYQKTLSFLSTFIEWPDSIDVSKLLNCLKRREVVTLLLYLTQV